MCKLKSGGLKSEVFAGGVGEYEAKVNVDDVTLCIQQDVTIVPESKAQTG